VNTIEKVARAMAADDGCDPDDPAYVAFPGGTPFGVCWRDKYASKARAALVAMREPSEGMRRAGGNQVPRAIDEGAVLRADDDDLAEWCFTAMIDHALSEREG